MSLLMLLSAIVASNGWLEATPAHRCHHGTAGGSRADSFNFCPHIPSTGPHGFCQPENANAFHPEGWVLQPGHADSLNHCPRMLRSTRTQRLTQLHTRGFFQPAEHGGEVGHTCIRSADGCRSSDLKPIRASGLVFGRAYAARPSRWDECRTLPEGLLTLSRALSARTASPEASNWRANRG